MFFRKKKKIVGAKTSAKKVLVLIDWDNIFICLHDRFKTELRLEEKIQKMLEWVQREIGEILEGHGFIFAPEHLSFFHQKMCTNNNLRLFTCPKKKLQKPEINAKSGEIEDEEDTVDETLIWFGKMMLRHPDVGFICLVAGDNDYVPLMEEAAKYNVKRALVPPTIDSLSRSKALVKLVDIHPVTLNKMLLRLDTL